MIYMNVQRSKDNSKYMKNKLSIEQVTSLPKLLQAANIEQVAKQLSVSRATINYWIKQLRKRGEKIELKRGSKSILENHVPTKI